MRTALALALVLALPASGATLTFEQALARAYEARGLSDVPEDALRILENPARFDWPIVRAEGAFSNARNADIFNESIVHSRIFSAIVSADYPLMDGGVSRLQREAARLDASLFRGRTRELERELHDEIVDAVARLYTAQERARILERGLERAASLRERAAEMLQVREISNVTAAQWQDEQLAAESELIALELQRLDAETRLKMLMGDASGEGVEIVLDLSSAGTALAQPPRTAAVPESVPESDRRRPAGWAGGVPPPAEVAARQRHLFFEQARAARRPQVLLSAFGGVADVGDRFALYGLRFTVALPMFDAAARRREAQARLEAAAADRERSAALDRTRREERLAAANIAGLTRRIEILARAVDIAKQRAASVARLTSAGLRSESLLASATADIARRESDLLAARVDLWKATQLRGR